MTDLLNHDDAGEDVNDDGDDILGIKLSERIMIFIGVLMTGIFTLYTSICYCCCWSKRQIGIYGSIASMDDELESVVEKK